MLTVEESPTIRTPGRQCIFDAVTRYGLAPHSVTSAAYEFPGPDQDVLAIQKLIGVIRNGNVVSSGAGFSAIVLTNAKCLQSSKDARVFPNRDIGPDSLRPFA